MAIRGHCLGGDRKSRESAQNRASLVDLDHVLQVPRLPNLANTCPLSAKVGQMLGPLGPRRPAQLFGNLLAIFVQLLETLELTGIDKGNLSGCMASHLSEAVSLPSLAFARIRPIRCDFVKSGMPSETIITAQRLLANMAFAYVPARMGVIAS